jgi:hypothetical protein
MGDDGLEPSKTQASTDSTASVPNSTTTMPEQSGIQQRKRSREPDEDGQRARGGKSGDSRGKKRRRGVGGRLKEMGRNEWLYVYK